MQVIISDKTANAHLWCSKQDLFRGLSFTTISSTGSNAAIIHYSPDPESCATIDPSASEDRFFLLPPEDVR